MTSRLRQLYPGSQFLRYLAVGGANTVIGYGLFSGTYFLLRARISEAHVIASIISNIIAIGIAFLGYKFIVFRTRGNIWHECLRCYLVYGTTAGISLALLVLVVDIGHMNAYLGQALAIAVTTIMSFFGHKRFTFRLDRKVGHPQSVSGPQVNERYPL